MRRVTVPEPRTLAPLGRPQALVLAAGVGERLRPLTLEIPKPLLPLRGRSLLDWRLRELARIRELGGVSINLHHLGDRIVAGVGTHAGRFPIHYSYETELLGTGGALAALRDRLGLAPAVLLANGDTWGRFPWRRLLDRHRRAGSALTLLVHRKAALETFGRGLGLSGNRLLEARKPRLASELLRQQRRVFAGAAVIDSALLGWLPEGPSDWIETLLEPALDRGFPVLAVATSAPWFDLGTPARYLEGVLEALPTGNRMGVWIHARAEVDATAYLARVAVEAGARVESRARLERALVMPGAVVAAGAQVREAIVGPGVILEAGSTLEGLLLTHNGTAPLRVGPTAPREAP